MLNKVIQTYPQPIASAYGQVLRSDSKSEPEQLDRILRCAEVTARYLTAMAIATFAAREDANLTPPEALVKFNGNLSFGHFVSVIQAVTKLSTSHPLKPEFSKSFQDKKSPAKGKLELLLNLRNELGHDLRGSNENTVRQIFITKNPLATLEELLAGIEPLCALPLFIVDTQKPIRKIIHIWRLLMMGEQKDPIPKQMAVSESFMDEKRQIGRAHV